MKLVTNNRNQPLLQLSNGQIINLNTLTTTTETNDLSPVKAEFEVRFSKHKNNKFLDKAQRLFKVSRVSKSYGSAWYKLESGIVLFTIVQGDKIQLIGNYPIHYLKLLYRFINTTL